MNTKKKPILRFIILLLFVNTIIVSCGWNNIHSKKTLLQFSELIESGNLSDLSLSIYYMNPFTSTRYPWSAEDLTSRREESKIVINSSRLEEHIDILNQINNTVLIPVRFKSHLNARLYYVFETKKDGKLLSVSMWGENNSMFVNGIEVQANDIFYDVVKPFLPEDSVRELGTYLNKS